MKRNTPSGFTSVVLVSQLRHELEQLVADLLAASESLPPPGEWCPPVDVVDEGAAIVVCFEVPGLAVEDLEVEVEGDLLHVRGRRRLRYPPDVRFHCLERSEGCFTRQLQVTQPVDFGRARVRLQAGLLRVELPKVEDRRRRRRTLVVERGEGGEP